MELQRNRTANGHAENPTHRTRTRTHTDACPLTRAARSLAAAASGAAATAVARRTGSPPHRSPASHTVALRRRRRLAPLALFCAGTARRTPRYIAAVFQL